MTGLLDRFRVRAELFHTGALCGVTNFSAQPGRGFLHVLRQGHLVITHHCGAGLPKRIELCEPTLVFYPQPLAHEFRIAPADGADFTCASLDFEGGSAHPLARALPSLVVLPLHQVDGLDASLTLLFAEADRVRCGHRLLANRLFEVVLLQLLRWLLDHPQEGGMTRGLFCGLADPALARTLTSLHEQPGAAWTLEAMAEQAGMSRSAFAVRFKAVMGMTPVDYLSDWRMAITKSLLQSGRSVKFIAVELGYSNASALSRVFTQRVGLSPRAWTEQAGTAR